MDDSYTCSCLSSSLLAPFMYACSVSLQRDDVSEWWRKEETFSGVLEAMLRPLRVLQRLDERPLVEHPSAELVTTCGHC